MTGQYRYTPYPPVKITVKEHTRARSTFRVYERYETAEIATLVMNTAVEI